MIKKTKAKATEENATKTKSEKTLVVVESPSKAKTINKYLGNKYHVEASVGHIKDLSNYKLGVDIENNFTPTYQTIKGKAPIVKNLKEKAKSSKSVLIATDPDREGEAIAYHIAEEIKKVNNQIKRVIFNEITKTGIKKGLDEPREIDEDLFMSQQARRVMDRIIGFKVSPFLSNAMIGKTTATLSAGRVQSVALRLICEREQLIMDFEPIEYWNIYADFYNNQVNKLKTQLVAFNNKIIKKPEGSKKGKNEEETKEILTKINSLNYIKNEVEADAILAQINKIEKFTVSKKTIKKIQRKPEPPFTTSTLQQEAARKLGFQNKRTMQIAQRLYEGVSIGKEGEVGLITYMRTDSVRISPEAIDSVRDYINSNFGKNYLPDNPNEFKAKSNNVQDAHEAIRPTNLSYSLDELKLYLSPEEFALYKLIFQRYVASQMTNADVEQTSIDISAEDLTFRATGSVIIFDGYMKIYEESKDDENGDEENGTTVLPVGINEGDTFNLDSATKKQAFTKAPPRYNQASLIKELDELGIGRPSTYATIVSTLLDREYVMLDNKAFRPTDLGFEVNKVLIHHFDNVFNVSFTAQMEDELDLVATGDKTYLTVMKEFYGPFSSTLQNAEKEHNLNSETKCPQCGAPLVIRVSRRGRFLGCSNYPECTYTQPLPKLNNPEPTPKPAAEVYPDAKCPICGKEMLVREGKFGRFLGCVDYPSCKGILPLPTQVICPKCKEGHLVERYSPKRKKKFWSCSNYPKCDYLTNYEPIDKECPNCHNYYLEYHYKKNGEDWIKFIKCPECKENFEETEIFK
ncbi:MAG: type I DNA topoisomerase [Candidatus Kapaibacteriota bacterium]